MSFYDDARSESEEVDGRVSKDGKLVKGSVAFRLGPEDSS
jgi:hypothetical protein